MFLFNSSLGIDFKRNHLILTLLRKSFGKIKLVDYQIHSLPAAEEKEEREAQTIHLINQFISTHSVNKDKISISIPREKVVVRFIQFPSNTKENLRKVLEYEATRFTPFENRDIYFDYHLIKEDRDWLYLFSVFVKKAEVDGYLSLLKKVGIKPLSIQIPSTAALNLFFYNKTQRKNETSILLEMTEPFFEVNLIQKGEWKESFHLAIPSKEKEEKIIQTFKRLGMIDDALSNSTFYIYGMDAEEKGLPSFEEVLSIKKISPPPFHRIILKSRTERPEKIYPSIGLPLKGLTNINFDINLLPFEMRKKVRQFGKPLFILLICLSLILTMTWGIGLWLRDRKELKTINLQIKKRRPEVAIIERLQREKDGLKKEISEFNKIRSGEVSKIELLKELTELLPNTAWVWNLKYTSKEVEISGFADSASDLITLLDKSPLFEKVEFSAPVTKEKERRMGIEKERERFKIKMRVEVRRSTF